MSRTAPNILDVMEAWEKDPGGPLEFIDLTSGWKGCPEASLLLKE